MSDQPAGTAEAIIKSRDAAVKANAAIISHLQAQYEAINDKAYDHPLSQQDKDEMGRIVAAIGALTAWERQMILMSLRSLNETAEVKRLCHVVDAVNKDVEAKLQEVQRFVSGLKEVADILSKGDEILQSLLKLAKAFGIAL